MFAVTVEFTLRSGSTEDFLPLIRENARKSVETEEGCLQFDVCRDAGDPASIFLYEVYRSPEAFRHHQTTRHFLDFDAAAAKMVERKSVRTYGEVFR